MKYQEPNLSLFHLIKRGSQQLIVHAKLCVTILNYEVCDGWCISLTGATETMRQRVSGQLCFEDLWCWPVSVGKVFRESIQSKLADISVRCSLLACAKYNFLKITVNDFDAKKSARSRIQCSTKDIAHNKKL